MQKTPTYIGLFALEPKDAAHALKTYSRGCLQLLLQQADSMALQQDYVHFDTLFHPPKDNHHITTLFIGGNEKALSAKQRLNLKAFPHGSKYIIRISLFVYVPGCIMVGYCPALPAQLPCDNAHPHVTLLLTSEAKPVESNAVLELVLAEWPGVLAELPEGTTSQIKGAYKGRAVYVVKREVEVPGVCGDNWKCGARK